MKIIQAPGRGSAVIGPGYFKQVNSEFFQQAIMLYGAPVAGSDRQFDVWKSIALQGQRA